jgi:hypothetical protein
MSSLDHHPQLLFLNTEFVTLPEMVPSRESFRKTCCSCPNRTAFSCIRAKILSPGTTNTWGLSLLSYGGDEPKPGPREGVGTNRPITWHPPRRLFTGLPTVEVGRCPLIIAKKAENGEMARLAERMAWGWAFVRGGPEHYARAEVPFSQGSVFNHVNEKGGGGLVVGIRLKLGVDLNDEQPAPFVIQRSLKKIPKKTHEDQGRVQVHVASLQ